MPEPEPSVRSFKLRRECGSASSPHTRGRTPAGSCATSRHWPANCSPPGTRCACSRPTTTTIAAPRCCTAAPARNGAPRRMAGPARRHDRLARERRRLEPRGHALRGRRRCGASCAPGSSTSSTCTSPSRRRSAGTRSTSADAPLVGTFHCYSESAPPHAIANLMGARRKLNRLTVRIAVSDAAAWTGRRFYGGEYRVVPNGVELPDGGAPARARPRARGAAGDRLRRPGRSSARGSRSCCARSRRCAATCRRG